MDYKDNKYNYRCYDYQEGFLKGCEDCYDLFRKDYYEYCLTPEYVPNTEDLESEAKYYRMGYIYGFCYAQKVLTEIGYFPINPKEASINILINKQLSKLNRHIKKIRKINKYNTKILKKGFEKIYKFKY